MALAQRMAMPAGVRRWTGLPLHWATSVAGRLALGVRAGAKVRRLQRARTRPIRLPALCVEDAGCSGSDKRH